MRPIALLTLLSLTIGATLPRHDFKLEERLPQSTLIYFQLRDIDAFRKTSIVRLIENPEVRAFLAPTLSAMEKRWKELGIEDLLGGSLTLALIEFGETPRVAGTLELPEKSRVLEEFRDRFAGEDAYKIGDVKVVIGPVHLAVKGDVMFAATDRDAMETALGEVKEKSLAKAEAFTHARDKVGADGKEAFFAWFNGREAVRIVREQLGEEGKMLDAFGLDSLGPIAASIRFRDGSVRETAWVGLKGKKGLARLLSLKKGAPLPAHVPKNALSYSSLNIDLQELYDTVTEVLSETGVGIEDDIDRIEKDSGVSIREDILGALGNRMSGWLVLPKLGLVPDSITAYEIADEDKLDKCLKSALRNLEAKIGEIPFQGKKINYIDFEVGEASTVRTILSTMYWLRDGKMLYVTGSGSLLGFPGTGTPNALKRMILARNADPLGSVDPVKSWLAGENQPAAMQYLDLEQGFNIAYNTLAPLFPLLGPLLKSYGIGVEAMKAPLGETVGRALGQSLLRVFVDEDGLRIEGDSKNGVTTTMLATGAMLAAIFYPVIEQALFGSKSAQCMNNMYRVYQKVWEFMMDNDGEWPSSTGPKFFKDLEMELACPHSGLPYRGPAVDPNKLKDDDILFADPPKSHPDNSIHAMYKSGEIRVLKPGDPDYEKALKATKK